MTASGNKIPTIYIFSVLFLWPLHINAAGATIPLYFFMTPLIFFQSKTTKRELITITILAIIIFFNLLSAELSGIIISAPSKSWASAFIIPIIILSLTISYRSGINGLSKYTNIFIFLNFSLQILEIMTNTDISKILHSTENSYQHYFLPINRYTGIYPEPSALAIGYSPLIYLIICHSQWAKKEFGKNSILTTLTSSLILCPSATLLSIISACIGLRILSTAKNPIIFLSSSFIFLLLTYLSYRYLPTEIIDRINQTISGLFSQKETLIENISSIVFLNGYDVSLNTLSHRYLGYGIMNMPSAYQEYVIKNDMLFSQLNNEDGSSILFKIVTEFGILGLVIYIYLFIKSMHSHLTDDISPWKIAFLLGIIFCTIRGASYFDGIAILALGFGLISKEKKGNNNV
jgi:hypothetical protein